MTGWHLSGPFTIRTSFFLLWSKQGVGQLGGTAADTDASELCNQHLSELPAQHTALASASLKKPQLDAILKSKIIPSPVFSPLAMPVFHLLSPSSLVFL